VRERAGRRLPERSGGSISRPLRRRAPRGPTLDEERRKERRRKVSDERKLVKRRWRLKNWNEPEGLGPRPALPGSARVRLGRRIGQPPYSPQGIAPRANEAAAAADCLRPSASRCPLKEELSPRPPHSQLGKEVEMAKDHKLYTSCKTCQDGALLVALLPMLRSRKPIRRRDQRAIEHYLKHWPE
jgi:hypothetical protein